jgi:glutaminase
MVTSKDVALMAATLANGGINPKTKQRIVKEKNVDYILDHMDLNGLYNQTEQLMKMDGVYAKSGVGGILMLVIPGVMGVGIVSPPLNKYGNSVKGILTMKMLMKCISIF